MNNRKGPFLIAEAGVNHNGELELAKRLIDAAAAAGADAVKFQTFRAESLVTASAPKARYQKKASGGTQLSMLKGLELSERAHRELFAHSRKRGCLFLSTPFDEKSADFIERLKVPIFKIASGELTNIPFLSHLARKGRPLMLSTGMSTLEEVSQAVAAIRESGDPPLTLLHCVSAYPARPEDANLRAMETLSRKFGLPVGFSDHTPGIEVAIAAAALGACVIEKHFTLDKNLPGPDHAASLDPRELAQLVRAVRSAALALGDGRKEPRPCEAELRRLARRSLVLSRPAKAGEVLRASTLAAKRPGTGIPPARIAEVIGRRLRRDAPADAVLKWSMLQ